MDGKLIHWKILSFFFDKDFFWIRVFWKFGISGRNTLTTKPTFSERNGYLKPLFKIGKWVVRKIK